MRVVGCHGCAAGIWMNASCVVETSHFGFESIENC